MTTYKHATLIADSARSTVELVAEGETRTIDRDGASVRRAMSALDGLSGEGWQVTSSSVGRLNDGQLFATYLLRQPVTETGEDIDNIH